MSMQRVVHRATTVTEQRRGGLLDRAVRVDFHEHPFGTALDVDALRDPRRDARSSRWIVAGERAVLESHAEALAGECERTGDHEQSIVVVRADPSALAVRVAAAQRQITGRPVDLIDLVGLTRIGSRWKREIGVTAELVQHEQLVVHSAPAAVGPAVREAPVAVDERPAIAGLAAARQMAVLCEGVQRLGELGRERRGRVAVVMEMHLDLAEPLLCQLAEPIEEIRPVLLAGKKEAVAWRPTIGIAIAARERRIAFSPRIDACAPDVVARMSP